MESNVGERDEERRRRAHSSVTRSEMRENGPTSQGSGFASGSQVSSPGTHAAVTCSPHARPGGTWKRRRIFANERERVREREKSSQALE